jgi:hypothetical protein
MSLSVSKGNVKGRRLHAFLRRMGDEFVLKLLDLTRLFARRLLFGCVAKNGCLVLMMVDCPDPNLRRRSAGGRNRSL